jgi:acetyl-CoA carboxylase biotin carboxyl carrier protein
MAILGFEHDDIARLLALVEAQELDELIIEEDGRTLRIRGPRALKPTRSESPAPQETRLLPQAPVASGRRAIPPSRPKEPHVPVGTPGEGQVALLSPMVGVFFRAEKPGAPAFAEIGQRIAVGQPIGLIEAMKVFSEVPAEHSGVIVAFPAQDGQLVQVGTPLVIIQVE